MPADGTLIPIMCEDVVPGGRYNISNEMLARMTPLVNPVYSRFDIYKHFFFVPKRILWKDWADFIHPKSGFGPNDELVFPAAKIENSHAATPDLQNIPLSALGVGGLADHLGFQIDPSASIPPGAVTSRAFSILPFRAYQRIWNDHFRDPDIEPEVFISDEGGFDYQLDADILMLRKKAWEKDYFTAARPYPQRGGASRVDVTPETGQPLSVNIEGEHANYAVLLGTDGKLGTGRTPATPQNVEINLGVDINDLREANAIQKLLERALRAGEHYHDMLKVFFGLKNPDSRFQRSEFIGGGRQPVSISEVLQTSQSETTPLGTYGGHGISAGNDRIGSFLAPEHGYIIGLCSIMPRATYGSQIRRDFFKTSRYDFYFPDLANLGEQQVDQVEIQANPFHADEAKAFGYQERWAEHRFIPSTVHGLFRNDGVLKLFTAARLGASDYLLDPEFLHVGTSDDVNRIFATTAIDPFLVSTLNKVTAILPIPKHSNPSLL